MHLRLVRNLAKVALACALLANTACTNLGAGDSSVAEAYQASDAVAISHYSRTIFSSTNF